MADRNGQIYVLQFSLANSKGGRTQWILNLWRNIDKKRFHFDFLTFDTSLSFEEELRDAGSQVFHLKNRPNNVEKFSEELCEILKKGYDVIHIATSFWEGLLIEELSRKANIPNIIIHSHSSGVGSNPLNKEKFTLHYSVREELQNYHATWFLACSQKASDWLYGDNISPEKKLIIKNGIDTVKFAYNASVRKEIRRKLNLENKFVLGFVGRLETVKNIGFLLEIFEKLYQLNPSIALLIVGDGNQKKVLEEKAKNIADENVIKFLGFAENTNEIYQAMDLFVLPSLFEGFPLVMLEAQCSGLKCVMNDTITDEVIVTENVEKASINEIEQWIKFISKAMHGYFRTNQADALIAAKCDIHSMVEQIERLYESV